MSFDMGSFGVITGSDWRLTINAVIDCGGRVVKVLLSNGKALRVQGETSDPSSSKVLSATATIVELKTIPTVHDFPDVLLDDLSGLPPSRQLDFCIELTPNVASVAKAPYRLALTGE